MKRSLQLVRKNSLLHFVDDERLICSRRNHIFLSEDEGDSWKKIFSLPCSSFESLLISNRLLRRLFRKYIFHIVPDGDIWIVFAFGKIYTIDISKNALVSVNTIKGSRPLIIAKKGNRVYYGEYTSNPSRHPISLFESTPDKRSFHEWYVFNDVRHIHSIQLDPYSEALFVATGDNDDECLLGYFDENRRFVKLVAGSQQARCIQLLFEKEYIYFASDAPDEENSIYRLKRSDHSVEKLQKVGGPVFYGFNNRGLLFFSTVCEPSEVNEQRYVELWASKDGVQWKCILKLQKDFWPMKLFQYGQIIFPTGGGNRDFVFFTAFATKTDQHIFRLSVKDILRILERTEDGVYVKN